MTKPKKKPSKLISTAVTAATTDNFNCQKNLSSANENIYYAKKPAVPAVVAVLDKNSKDYITSDE